MLPSFGVPFLFKKNNSSLLTGLISSWKLDSNVLDSHGVNHGTATSLTYGTGKISQAAVFDGSTSYITLPNVSSYQLPAFSVSLWCKVTGVVGSVYELFSVYSQDIDPSGFALRVVATGLVSTIVGFPAHGGGYALVSGGSSIVDGNWHHVALVCATGWKLYVDNVQVDAQGYSSADFLPADKAHIGVNEHPTSTYRYPFSGVIDEVLFYNRAISPAEVSQLWNSGAGRAYPF